VSVRFGEHAAPVFVVCNIAGEESVTVQTPFDLGAGESWVFIQRSLISIAPWWELRGRVSGLAGLPVGGRSSVPAGCRSRNGEGPAQWFPWMDSGRSGDGSPRASTDNPGGEDGQSVRAVSRPRSTSLNREGNQSHQVRIGSGGAGIRQRQGLSFLQEHLRKVFEGARDHQASVGKVETLADRSREIERFGHNHPLPSPRKVVRDVVAQHLLKDSLVVPRRP